MDQEAPGSARRGAQPGGLSAAAAAPPTPPPGLPARFTLLRPLGQGGAGTVHAAHDRERGAPVALKLIDLGAGAGATPVERFLAETRAATRLAHPDIAATLDAGHAGRLGWIAMELAPGTDLSRYTRPARRLPETVALRVGERLAAALAHAHAAGVLHRDLKPSNVLVDWSRDSVKLVDFGLARQDDVEITRTGVMLGTPAYMAPELLAGRPASARSDLYALGVLLYQLLAGRLPFEAATLGALLQRVAHEPAPRLDDLQPGLPPGAADLVAALLAPEPAQRPADGAAVAAALRALHGAPG